MERCFKNLLLILLISVFFSDWGFFIRKGNRPILSFPEVLVIIFCGVWLLRKLLEEKLKIPRESFVFFFLIFGIIISASIGAILNFKNIDKNQHFFGILRFFFWGIFLFCFFDLAREVYQDINFSRKLWKYYLDFSLLIAIIGIFQYIFYLVFGKHLNLNPYFQQHWGTYGGYYRATSIFQEPSFLGVILCPIFIASTNLFLQSSKVTTLIKTLILFMGILASLSLGSFIVIGVFILWQILTFLIRNFLFFRISLSKTSFFLLIVVPFIVLLICKLMPRIVFEVRQLANYFSLFNSGGSIAYSSGIGRVSSYKGFLVILKTSPFFGVGFDQGEYISTLLNTFFETNTGSGIFGFIGTSAGICGVILMFLLFYLIFRGGIQGQNPKLKNISQLSTLLIVGKAMVLTLLLEQLIAYGGILNPDFWIPLAFGALFIKSGYYQIKEEHAK